MGRNPTNGMMWLRYFNSSGARAMVPTSRSDFCDCSRVGKAKENKCCKECPKEVYSAISGCRNCQGPRASHGRAGGCMWSHWAPQQRPGGLVDGLNPESHGSRQGTQDCHLECFRDFLKV